MKKQILLILAIACTCFLSPAYSSEKLESAKLLHHVFFWLNEPDDKQVIKEFYKGLEMLADIEVIRELTYGVPAGTPREVVDNSYTVYYVSTFDNAEDLQAYDVHPIHKEFVDKYKSYWNKVIVYDVIQTRK